MAGRRRIWRTMLFAVLGLAGVAVLFHAIFSYHESEDTMGAALIAAAAITVTWIMSVLSRLWTYELRKPCLVRAFVSAALILMVGFATATYSPLLRSSDTGGAFAQPATERQLYDESLLTPNPRQAPATIPTYPQVPAPAAMPDSVPAPAPRNPTSTFALTPTLAAPPPPEPQPMSALAPTPQLTVPPDPIAAITVHPSTSLSAGDEVTITGVGFSNDCPGGITVRCGYATVLSGVQPGSDGRFAATFVVPDAGSGLRRVVAGDSCGSFADAVSIEVFSTLP